jgi:hypothetical protein
MTQADREQFEREARLQLPGERFIVGFGEGTSRAEAEERARGQVAAALQSEVRQTLRAFQSERRVNGRTDAVQDVAWEVESRVATRFGAQIVPRGVRAVGGTWLATAAADRTALDRAIEADAQRRVRDAAPLWQRIAAAGAWLEAAPGWCEAAAAAGELDALHAERLAVSGRPVWTEDRTRLWVAAARRRDAARAAIQIQVAGLATPGVQDPAPAVVSAVQGAGWRAGKREAAGCAKDALVVEPRVERECRPSALGVEVCKAALVIEGRGCGAPDALFAERSPEAQGTHATDEAAAFRRAAGQIAVKPAVDRAVARLLAAIGDGCPRGPAEAAPGAAKPATPGR